MVSLISKLISDPIKYMASIHYPSHTKIKYFSNGHVPTRPPLDAPVYET